MTRDSKPKQRRVVRLHAEEADLVQDQLIRVAVPCVVPAGDHRGNPHERGKQQQEDGGAFPCRKVDAPERGMLDQQRVARQHRER